MVSMDSNRDRALLELADEIYRCYFLMKEQEDSLNYNGGSTARATMLLLLQGPASVPDLARNRTLSRQRMQQVVDTLYENGWLLKLPNPRHRRSPLIGLTSSGKKEGRRLLREERKFFQNRLPWISPKRLGAAVNVVREFREDLEQKRKHTEKRAGMRLRILLDDHA